MKDKFQRGPQGLLDAKRISFFSLSESILGDLLKKFGHDLVGANAVAFGTKTGNQPVTENRLGDGPNILNRGMDPAIEEGIGLGAQQHGLISARACTIGKVFIYEIGSLTRMGTG